MTIKTGNTVGLAAALLLGGASAGYWLHASAQTTDTYRLVGIPSDAPLSYVGTLADASGPIDGTVAATFGLHSAASGDTMLCEESVPDLQVVGGRFEYLFPGTCMDVIIEQGRASASLWIEVSVTPDGGSPVTYPRTRIRAVPYAMSAAFAYSSRDMEIENSVELTSPSAVSGSTGGAVRILGGTNQMRIDPNDIHTNNGVTFRGGPVTVEPAFNANGNATVGGGLTVTGTLTTNGAIEANDPIRVRDRIEGVTFDIGDSPTATQAGAGRRDVFTSRRRSEGWFCALGRVAMRDNEDGDELASCSIFLAGGNDWTLRAEVQSGSDAIAQCSAMCVQFPRVP